MKVVSLFSGAGGLDLGFVEAGAAIRFAADTDPWARETYVNNLGHRAQDASVADLVAADLPPSDIVVAGPPCQGFSSIGAREGSRAGSTAVLGRGAGGEKELP